MVDWEAIKKEVEGSSASVRSIARRYGVSHTSINKKIKIGKFKRYVPPNKVSKKNTENIKSYKPILGDIALRKIDELKTELGKHYSNVDEPLIVMYAKSYERYIELEMKIAQEGVVSRSPKTLATYINPTYNVLQMTQKTLVTIANQLGLSMISRKNLGLKLHDKKGEPSLFDFVDQINNNMDIVDV